MNTASENNFNGLHGSRDESRPEQMLSLVLSTCRTRVEAARHPRSSRAVCSNDAEVAHGRFHFIGAQEYLLTGPSPHEPHRLGSGDLVIFLNGTRHGLTPAQLDSAETLLRQDALVLNGEFEFLSGDARALLQAVPDYLIVRSREASPQFRDLAGSLLTVSREHWFGRQIVMNQLATCLLALAICEHAFRTGAPPEALVALQNARIARVLEAIHSRPGERWSIRSLAAVAGMSRSTFTLQFSTVIGMPPMRYLTLWRMAEAKRLLQDKSLSVAKVAEIMGYSSEAVFRKSFKRVEGIGPGKARADSHSSLCKFSVSSGSSGSVSRETRNSGLLTRVGRFRTLL
jgi:AraC family transcriptional regulator, activator of mtrCDE